MSIPAHAPGARPGEPAGLRQPDPRRKILLVSHKQRRCGVHEYGLNISKALSGSKAFAYIYAECGDRDEFYETVARVQPAAILYNYTFVTLPWVRRRIIRKIDVPHIGIIHEGARHAAEVPNTELFHFVIVPDPSLLLHNPLAFKTGRLVPPYVNRFPIPEVPTIGSFGFGLEGKGFDELILKVQEEFDQAVIRLHIAFNDIVDPDGAKAVETGHRCRSLVHKPGITIQLSHDFLTHDQLLDFLAQNSLNAFLYAKFEGRGPSSVIDYALAVQRPIAITRSTMFHHILGATPSICVEDASLRQIMDNGINPLLSFIQDWSESLFVWDYDRIVERVLGTQKLPEIRPSAARRAVRRIRSRLGLMPAAGDKRMKASGEPATDAVRVPAGAGSYDPIVLPPGAALNRILDDEARLLYAPALQKLFELAPGAMARKMPRANVQQAFVLDTVARLASGLNAPVILAVGAYEDTASLGLRLLGHRIQEIDPVLNYDLDMFFHKPTTNKGSYDIIFATSVLEHVEDDGLFISQIASLLAPGGTAVLTCDFRDQYKPGDRIPQEDFRFYTRNDLMQRIIPVAVDCALVDPPHWECPSPDFEYAGCHYTFATLVFRKAT